MQAQVNGITLHYEGTGTGPPLLLLHGNGEDHHIFDPLANRLSQDFTVYALDSRNHGQSERTGDYSYETMAEDVRAFVDALVPAPVDLIGFSDGGIVGLLLAMKHPALLRRMALLGVNLSPDDFTEESHRFVRETYAETGDPLFRLMLEQPDIPLDEVRGVNTPTLLVAAEHDIFRPETFENLLSALPDAVLKVMEGHEHDSYIAGQDLLYPDLIDFFRK